jgi:putative nucleotidyltransferase with HDIG domain
VSRPGQPGHLSHLGHLVRRFAGAWSRREPAVDDVAWAREALVDAEWSLWSRMPVADRRHSIEVARRFAASSDGWGRDEIAAALLHDVGKIESGLGTLGRTVATMVGPRTRRFRAYHDHERIGAELLHGAGAPEATVELVAGRGDTAARAAIERADDSI